MEYAGVINQDITTTLFLFDAFGQCIHGGGISDVYLAILDRGKGTGGPDLEVCTTAGEGVEGQSGRVGGGEALADGETEAAILGW